MAKNLNVNETFFEQAKFMMTLRSGKVLEQPQLANMSGTQTQTELPGNKEDPKERDESIFLAPVLRVPFASAPETPLPSDKMGVKMKKMLELFKQVHINLLLCY